MVARAIADPQTEGQTLYPFVHPIHVVKPRTRSRRPTDPPISSLLPVNVPILRPPTRRPSKTHCRKPHRTSQTILTIIIRGHRQLYPHVPTLHRLHPQILPKSQRASPLPSLLPERALGGRSRRVLQGGFCLVGISCFPFLAFAHRKFTLDVPDCKMVGGSRHQFVSRVQGRLPQFCGKCKARGMGSNSEYCRSTFLGRAAGIRSAELTI